MRASPLHDIGKVGVPDSILLKPGKLTDSEFNEIKKHTLYGERILEGAKSPLLQLAARMAASHHEKVDGTGYPRGLKGDQIPMEARIVAVADVFDALCTKRTYKEAWAPDKALEHIRRETGKSFDPQVASAFEQAFAEILHAFEEIKMSDSLPVH